MEASGAARTPLSLGGLPISLNGTGSGQAKLELKDLLVIETTDNRKLEFEVVGIVEDEQHTAYGVCYNEQEDEFVVTDDSGQILEDDALAQEILDDFLVLAEESAPPAENA